MHRTSGHEALQPRATRPDDAQAAALASLPTQLDIGGAWRDGGDGGTIAVEDPATHSGVGRAGGPEGIEEYLELKYVATSA